MFIYSIKRKQVSFSLWDKWNCRTPTKLASEVVSGHKKINEYIDSSARHRKTIREFYC